MGEIVFADDMVGWGDGANGISTYIKESA